MPVPQSVIGAAHAARDKQQVMERIPQVEVVEHKPRPVLSRPVPVLSSTIYTRLEQGKRAGGRGASTDFNSI